MGLTTVSLTILETTTVPTPVSTEASKSKPLEVVLGIQEVKPTFPAPIRKMSKL